MINIVSSYIPSVWSSYFTTKYNQLECNVYRDAPLDSRFYDNNVADEEQNMNRKYLTLFFLQFLNKILFADDEMKYYTVSIQRNNHYF